MSVSNGSEGDSAVLLNVGQEKALSVFEYIYIFLFIGTGRW